MKTNILEAKNHLSRLIEAAQAGEDVVIANRGKPVARLVPVRDRDPRTAEPGTAQAILEYLKRHPLTDYARRTAKEIDADIEDARNSWD